jgi:hypothetical protein
MNNATPPDERERRRLERESRKGEDTRVGHRGSEETRAASTTTSTTQKMVDLTANKRPRDEALQPSTNALDLEDEASFNEDVNRHITNINCGGKDEDMLEPTETSEEEEEDDVRDLEKSPEKKKKRKEKKGKRRSNTKEKEPRSILKPGRFSPSANSGKQNKTTESKQTVEAKRKSDWGEHRHKHARVVLVCSVVCSQEGTEAKMNEFVMATRALYKHMIKVDASVVWEPVQERGARLWDPQGIPADFTDCGTWIKVSGDAGVFEMRKPRQNVREKRNRGGDDDDLVDPEVYFQCCISCDVDPEFLLERVSFEWARIGGNRLNEKEISSFATKPAVCLYHVRNDPNHAVVIPELTRMLEEVRDRANEEIVDFFGIADPPQFTLSMQTPKVVGQNTQQFQGWDWRKQNWRKTLHIVVKAEDVKYMQDLFAAAKDLGILTKYMGPNARVVMVHDSTKKSKRGEPKADLSKYDMAAVASYSRRHINYQANSRYDGIRGIWNVDKEFKVCSVTDPDQVVATVSLRTILYTQIKTADGLPLFCEIHQGEPMGPVDVVVGAYEEAERMLLMINKNPGAYLYYYLASEAKMDEAFVRAVVVGTIDPFFVREIDACNWDSETRVLTTPQDVANEKSAAMESAAWYKDVFGENVFDMSKKEAPKKMSAAELEDLHAEHSVKTATKQQGRYAGSPGAETFVVGQKPGMAKPVSEAQGEEADLEKYSREELLVLLRKAKISPHGKGSQPRTAKASEGTSDVEDGSSISESSSSSSGSSNDSSSSSSDEDKSPVQSLASRE